MPDFSFRDRPDKQRVQLTLGKASSSADTEQVLAFLNFQWTFRTMQATYEQLLDQYQLSESKFIILMLLENETDHTLLPSELATKLGSARATVSKLLVGLQKRGWVENQHPQDDKRTVAIHLTAAGSSVLTQFLPANFKAVTTIFASFTVQEQQQFKGLLDKIKQGTQQLKSEAINHE